LGDLDKESFISLISFFKENEDCAVFNELVSFIISLKLQLVVCDEDIKQNVNDFLLFNNAKHKLNELKLFTNLNISDKEYIKQLFDIIYYKSQADKVYLEISNFNHDIIKAIEKELITTNKIILERVNDIFRKKNILTTDKIYQSVYNNIVSYLKIPQHKGIYCKQ
jgi:signal peptidase I